MNTSFINYDRVRDCIRRRRTTTTTTCRCAPHPRLLLLLQLTRCILLPTLLSHTRVMSSTHIETLLVTFHLGRRSRCWTRQRTRSVAILTRSVIDDYGYIYHRIGFVKVIIDVVVDNDILIHTVAVTSAAFRGGADVVILRCRFWTPCTPNTGLLFEVIMEGLVYLARGSTPRFAERNHSCYATITE